MQNGVAFEEVQNGVAVEKVHSGFTEIIHMASDQGYVEYIEAVLNNAHEAEFSLDDVDEKGMTALMKAANKGHTRIAEMLIEGGVNVNLIGPDDRTALDFARDDGHQEIVDMLIDAGAMDRAQKPWSPPPLPTFCDMAAGCSPVELLLETGGDPNATFPDGTSLLMFFAAKKCDFLTVRALISAGANVHHRNSDGFYAVTLALICGNYAVSALLIDAGADPNGFTNAKMSALMHLAMGQCPEHVLWSSATKGVDVNATNGHGWNALMCACVGGNAEIIKDLVYAGADVEAVNDQGKRAVDIFVASNPDRFANVTEDLPRQVKEFVKILKLLQ